MIPHLCDLGAVEAIAAIRRGDFSAEELVSAYTRKIVDRNQLVLAWIYFDVDLALEQARAVDRKIEAGEEVGKLSGIPVGVKDVFNTKDMPTQMGSPIWEGFQSGNDARVIYYLRMADGVVMGKTVTAEFAVHTPGPTRNPCDLQRSPGTSSSGSAAAVAANMVPLALGTQTAGSIIRPASYCGVFGFKPSFGLVPRTGVLKTTDTLDTVGGFARTAEDLGLLFEVVRVRGRDFPIHESMVPERSCQPAGRPWRIAWVRGPTWGAAESYAREDLQALAEELDAEDDFEAEELELPELAEAHDIHSVIYDRTLAYYFRAEFKEHTLVSPAMYQIIERGDRITLDQYREALVRQQKLAATLDTVFEKYDVILSLSTGGEAPMFGADDRPDNCLTWTLCWMPTISIPAFHGPSGLPYGAQITARRYGDRLLLGFAQELDARGLLTGRSRCSIETAIPPV